MPARILFVTGTDTGVGKTLLTGLLLEHLRQSGRHALALKPFCAGSRSDVDRLRALQGRALTCDEINPFYFKQPLAPLVAARKQRRRITLEHALNHIRRFASSTNPSIRQSINPSLIRPPPTLLVEGIGGLLVPLGPGYSVADLIAQLHCSVIVVAPNRLGTINHTLLTIRALQNLPSLHPENRQPQATAVPSQRPVIKQLKHLTVVLMDQAKPDSSAQTNPRLLAELLAPVPLISLPFLGPNANQIDALKESANKFKKTLARILH